MIVVTILLVLLLLFSMQMGSMGFTLLFAALLALAIMRLAGELDG